MTLFTTIKIEEFKVVGIFVRTTNQYGQSQNDIGNLWGKFMNKIYSDKFQTRTQMTFIVSILIMKIISMVYVYGPKSQNPENAEVDTYVS